MPDDPNGGDQTSGGSSGGSTGGSSGGSTGGSTGGGTKTGEFPAWAEGPKVDETQTSDKDDARGGTKTGEFGG